MNNKESKILPQTIPQGEIDRVRNEFFMTSTMSILSSLARASHNLNKIPKNAMLAVKDKPGHLLTKIISNNLGFDIEEYNTTNMPEPENYNKAKTFLIDGVIGTINNAVSKGKHDPQSLSSQERSILAFFAAAITPDEKKCNLRNLRTTLEKHFSENNQTHNEIAIKNPQESKRNTWENKAENLEIMEKFLILRRDNKSLALWRVADICGIPYRSAGKIEKKYMLDEHNQVVLKNPEKKNDEAGKKTKDAASPWVSKTLWPNSRVHSKTVFKPQS